MDIIDRCNCTHNNRAGTKSHARYEGYKTARTLAAYLALGGSRADAAFDAKRGWVFC